MNYMAFVFSNVNPKCVIETSKKALGSTNPAVRTAAISLVGTLYLYMGATLYVFFENEKPALRDQISAEFAKYDGQKAPNPTKGNLLTVYEYFYTFSVFLGVPKSASSDVLIQEDDEDAAATTENNQINLQDLLPRVDISPQITEALLTEMTDKDWKLRNEALTKLSTIISEAKLIKPNVGDLPQVLALRLVDSNTKIAQTALNICETIATAMGPPCKHFVRVLLPGFLQGRWVPHNKIYR